MANQKRVALLIDTATSWGTGLIEGIAEYAKASGKNWVFSIEPRGKYDRTMLPEQWNGHGVVARITHSPLAEQLIAMRVPAVNVSWYPIGESLIPRVTCDEQAAAKLAFKYLQDTGFRQFAYCGSTLRPNYYDRFGATFCDTICEAGYVCPRFSPVQQEFAKLNSEQQLQELSQWLVGLPRPVALLAFDDLQGRQVTEACTQVGLLVPQDVAVLGGEHDELTSRISTPPLSSIDQGPHEVGFRAAERLDQLMRGEDIHPFNVLLPPRRIIARQSTDKIALQDDLLAQAVRFIRDHISEDFQIEDILHEVPMSRRALEMAFRKHFGRTPRDEVRRVRVDKAIQLLCDTDWSVTSIARACGFGRPELLTRAFCRELRTTPSDFRKRVSARQDATDPRP